MNKDTFFQNNYYLLIIFKAISKATSEKKAISKARPHQNPENNKIKATIKQGHIKIRATTKSRPQENPGYNKIQATIETSHSYRLHKEWRKIIRSKPLDVFKINSWELFLCSQFSPNLETRVFLTRCCIVLDAKNFSERNQMVLNANNF